MTEELGFRTPAKEIERLRKRLEQIEDVSEYVPDVAILSIWALAEIHGMQAMKNPRNARKLKDSLLDALKEAKISRELLDSLDALLKINCELLEGKTA